MTCPISTVETDAFKVRCSYFSNSTGVPGFTRPASASERFYHPFWLGLRLINGERSLRIGTHASVDHAGREAFSIERDLRLEYTEVRTRLKSCGGLGKRQKRDDQTGYLHQFTPRADEPLYRLDCHRAFLPTLPVEPAALRLDRLHRLWRGNIRSNSFNGQ